LKDHDISSPFLLTTQLVSELKGRLSAIDIYQLPAPERKIVIELQHNLVDARLDTRDYELSETRDEQLNNAKVAKKRLAKVRRGILAASEYNIFSSIDVAQLTATIDHIAERLE
jgi:hypothetical protein